MVLVTPPSNGPGQTTLAKETQLVVLNVGLAMYLGWVIALPAVAFAFLGRALDRYLGTPHIFLVLGIFFAIVVSAFFVVRKTREIVARTERLSTPPSHGGH